jgi:hypothetical protein
MPHIKTICRAAFALTVTLAATPAAAQGLDGVYLGKLGCEVLVGQTRRALATDIRITIAGTTVTYEREILSPEGNQPTGIKERGTGKLTPPSITMGATGSGNSWSYTANYSGTIAGGAITMSGVQKWHVNRANQDRPCTITARR